MSLSGNKCDAMHLVPAFAADDHRRRKGSVPCVRLSSCKTPMEELGIIEGDAFIRFVLPIVKKVRIISAHHACSTIKSSNGFWKFSHDSNLDSIILGE